MAHHATKGRNWLIGAAYSNLAETKNRTKLLLSAIQGVKDSTTKPEAPLEWFCIPLQPLS